MHILWRGRVKKEGGDAGGGERGQSEDYEPQLAKSRKLLIDYDNKSNQQVNSGL